MKSLIQAWKNRNKILEGIKNSVFKTEHVEEVAAERMNICNSCPEIDNEGSKCMVPGTQPCCGVCGCKLAFKIRSLSSACDLGKWDAVMSQEEEDELRKDIGDIEDGNNI